MSKIKQQDATIKCLKFLFFSNFDHLSLTSWNIVEYEVHGANDSRTTCRRENVARHNGGNSSVDNTYFQMLRSVRGKQ